MGLSQVRWVTIFCLVMGPAIASGSEPLSVGTGPDYPPFSDQKMEDGGVGARLVQLVLERMGHSVELEWKPWNRLLKEARALEFDAVYPYIRTPEREEDFLHSEPLFEVRLRFFAAKEATGSLIESVRERPLQVCRPNGYAINEGLRPHLKHDFVEWVRPASLESCFLMLARNRVDLVPINQATGRYTIERTFDRPPQFRGFEAYEETATHHLLVPRDLPGAEAFMAEFNQALAATKASPAGEDIVNEIERFLVDD